MKLEIGTSCWIPDTRKGWVPARVKNVEYDTQIKKHRIQLTYEDEREASGETIVIETTDLNEDNDKLPKLKNMDDGVDDLTTLPHLNEPSVLNAVKLRYLDKIIYTFSGVVLIAMNPFERVDELYTSKMIEKYQDANMSDNSPHLFAIANESYKAMIKTGKSQSIIVSGESGAGKTVSAKYIMRFFASVHNNGGSIGTTEIENQILATNPIMESFGNAKTTRNDNSSRFGKYLRISFDNDNMICGAKIQVYLLERSRLVYQSANERNYHIFYQLVNGLSEEMKTELGLTKCEDYQYLYQGNTTSIKDVDDKREFEITCDALETIGLDTNAQFELFKVLAALLHIGNINISNSRNEAGLDTDDIHLVKAASLLGIDAKEFAKWIVKKKISTRSDNIASSLKYHEAIVARDSVSKYIYSLLFDWLVSYINIDLSPSGNNSTENSFIGVLDIYGFEHFDSNSFEQFCINYANEKLQQQFTHHVFKIQQEEYIKEGIEWSFITYLDNQPCIDLIENHDGIISLLDEQCKLPSGSDKTWAEKMFHSYINPPYNKVFKKTRFGTDKFVVSHYALDVSYEVDGFIEKNRDTVPEAQTEVLRQTSNPFLLKLLSSQDNTDSAPVDLKRRSMNRNKKPTLGHIFKKSLKELMSTITSTDAHYIRCIKPNEEKQAWLFDNPMVLSQLRACGVLETIRISLVGFPSKYTYEEFLNRFRVLYNLEDMRKIQHLDDLESEKARKLCVKLLNDTIEDHTLFQAGKTKLFFRSGVLGQLEVAKANRMNSACVTIQKHIRRYLMRKTWIEARISMIELQSLMRGVVVKQKVAGQLLSLTATQSLIRGSLIRCDTTETFKSVDLVQRHIRGANSRNEYNRLKAELEEQERERELEKQRAAALLIEQQRKDEETAEAARNLETAAEAEKLRLEEEAVVAKLAEEERLRQEQIGLEADSRIYQEYVHEGIENDSFTSKSTTLFETVKENEKDVQNWIQIQSLLPPDVTKETIMSISPADGLKMITDHVVNRIKLISDRVNNSEFESDDNSNIYLTSRIKANIINDIDTLKHTTKRAKFTEIHEVSTSKRNSISENVMFDRHFSINTYLERNYRASFADLSEYMNSSKIAPTLTANILLSNLESPIDDSRMPVDLGEMVFPSRLVNLLLMDMWTHGMIDEATIFLEKCLNILKSELINETDTSVIISKGTFLLNNVNRIRVKIASERAHAMQDLNTELSGIERKKYLKMLLIVKRYCDTIFGQMYYYWISSITKDLDKKVLHAIAVDDTVFAVQQNARNYFKHMIQEGSKYKMLDLISVFNNVYLALKINGFDEFLSKSVLQDMLTYIDLTAFNKIMKNPKFLNVKKCNLLKSNMSILLDWCKDRHITDAPIRLMHILTLTQILQLKSLGLGDINSIMEHTQDLSEAQVRRILEESDKNEAAQNNKLQRIMSNGSSIISLLSKENEDEKSSPEYLLPVHDGMFESMPLKLL